MALWCAALLVPWLRQPGVALVALSLPVLFFYVRAEVGQRRGQPEARRYRNSAAVLGFVIMALYVFRGVVHMVMFPDTRSRREHYHQNARAAHDGVAGSAAAARARRHRLAGVLWRAGVDGRQLFPAHRLAGS